MENDPYRAISIDSAKINTSHVLMKECHIARRNNWQLTWACQKFETCSGELLLLLPRLATPLGLPWIPFISIQLVCHWTGSFKIWSTLLRPHVNQGEYPQSSSLPFHCQNYQNASCNTSTTSSISSWTDVIIILIDFIKRLSPPTVHHQPQ